MTASAKKIQVSIDGGTTWYTMPGNTGTFQDTAGNVDDTVFGQDYKSNQPTSITGKITSNAYFKGFAGYVATIKQSGTATAVVGGAMTLVSGKTYQISTAAQNLIDHNSSYTVKDNGVAVAAANIADIDFLFGQVTFAAGYTPTGPITIDYSYLPLASIAKSQSFTLTQTAVAVDNSDFDTLQGNSGHEVYIQGLKTVELEVKGFYDSTNNLETILDSREELVIEINPDGSGQSVARGYFRPSDLQLSGHVGNIEDSTIKFTLSVPDVSELYLPFEWVHTNTTLPTALLNALNAWVAGSTIGVQYLPDGTNGYQALDCIVTEMTLTGGLKAMNTFAATFQISGAVTTV